MPPKVALDIVSSGQVSILKGFLDDLYKRYDRAYLLTDPVQFPHEYDDPRDREVVAFIAALFAFGNVGSIIKSVRKILEQLGKHPSERLAGPRCEGFVHRWVTERDLGCLLRGLGLFLRENDSLKESFLEKYSPSHADLSLPLSDFVKRLRKFTGQGSMGLRFLLNDPATGAACKRLNMFLRWMVRPADGVDFGLWTDVSPAQLVIPIDTHIARISRFLGLTDRKTANWKMAREITDRLREFDPADPVKYDFALSRIGIVEGCRGYRHEKVCPACPINPVCRAPGKMLEG